MKRLITRCCTACFVEGYILELRQKGYKDVEEFSRQVFADGGRISQGPNSANLSPDISLICFIIAGEQVDMRSHVGVSSVLAPGCRSSPRIASSLAL